MISLFNISLKCKYIILSLLSWLQLLLPAFLQYIFSYNDGLFFEHIYMDICPYVFIYMYNYINTTFSVYFVYSVYISSGLTTLYKLGWLYQEEVKSPSRYCHHLQVVPCVEVWNFLFCFSMSLSPVQRTWLPTSETCSACSLPCYSQ